MRFLIKLVLWLAVIIGGLIALAYVTGNGHIPRGVRYTYLIGRNGPEIDDRNFFPYATIPADAPKPWPKGTRYGKLSITKEQTDQLLALNTVGFVVIQDDSLIYEDYYGGWRADSVSNSFSVAKSYISLLVGIAVKEGRIKSISTPVSEYLPEFAQLDPCHAGITLRHLLTMSTGLDWSESGGDPFSDNAKGYYGTNVRELAMDQPCRTAPGVEFDYISGSTQIVADVLQQVYGQPLDQLVREKIWGPLGAEHTAYWGKDREDGDFKAFCCLYGTARDFARIGQLYLDSGKWEGGRLITSDYWRESITPANITDHGQRNKRYGLFWWIAELDGRPIFYCRGFHGEYVVVIPHERTVMVRTGSKWEEKNEEGHPKDVFQWIAIARSLTQQHPA
ncbi:MAG TPA: serine hydrolase [Flavobacteriales bacterium]